VDDSGWEPDGVTLQVRFCEGGGTSRDGIPAATLPGRQDLTDHNCINLRLPTYGGLYAWEFKKGDRETNVRVEGQLIFNGTTQMLNAALDGFGLAYVPEDLAQRHIAQGRLNEVLEEAPSIARSLGRRYSRAVVLSIAGRAWVGQWQDVPVRRDRFADDREIVKRWLPRQS